MTKDLNILETAMLMQVGVELVEYFMKHCPKRGELTTLPYYIKNDDSYFERDKVISFMNYLSKPWPRSPKGQRPHIPERIKEDIKRESFYACAICGDMNHGEIAHIEPVSVYPNNSPYNLIYLCPNHHTQYDYGYKLSTNITIEEVKQVKSIKQSARKRILRYEANATMKLTQLINIIHEVKDKMEEESNSTLQQVYLTESKQLLKGISSVTKEALKQARKDQEATPIDKFINTKAPYISDIIGTLEQSDSKVHTEKIISEILNQSEEIIIDLDEEECPHCYGYGIRGLNGKICTYCDSVGYVTREKKGNYDRTKFNEVDCPHCYGKGFTGLVFDLCIYCKGDQVVTSEKAEVYDFEEVGIDFCPACEGNGIIGINGTLCTFCGGSLFLPKETVKQFDEKKDLGKPCPHCDGRGTTGLNNKTCIFCKGDSLITQEKAASYDINDIDEVECPHCNGSGTQGLNGVLCSYCNGDQKIMFEESNNYDRGRFDEVECPRCNGRGLVGYNGTVCPLCKGDQIVSSLIATTFNEGYKQKYEK
ncbi:hypothetical protein COF07_10260 [Bacillus wiedmannii]|uniref:HNH endonuclease n=1 Tax=Bacillus wiedmannii TaxID=1890302 RepID=UPI000BFBC977|nr:HNH endonuclease [Bacillus wiedmannii]PHA58718.1 hypothetical protein COF07_10260 [Bacillus wiedmannii]